MSVGVNLLAEARDTFFERAYARYIPRMVVDRFRTDPTPLSKPEQVRFAAAVAFVDISGFTKLSESLVKKYGLSAAEMLNHHISGFFEKLIDVIFDFGGDIIKFAGDAILVVWHHPHIARSDGSKAKQLLGPSELPMSLLIMRALACNMKLLTLQQTADDVRLSLHSGIGAGWLNGLFVGGCDSAWEFFVAGDPIRQMSEAGDAAEAGEVFMSPESYLHVVDFVSARSRGKHYQLIKVNEAVAAPTFDDTIAEHMEPALLSFVPQLILRRSQGTSNNVSSRSVKNSPKSPASRPHSRSSGDSARSEPPPNIPSIHLPDDLKRLSSSPNISSRSPLSPPPAAKFKREGKNISLRESSLGRLSRQESYPPATASSHGMSRQESYPQSTSPRTRRRRGMSVAEKHELKRQESSWPKHPKSPEFGPRKSKLSVGSAPLRKSYRAAAPKPAPSLVRSGTVRLQRRSQILQSRKSYLTIAVEFEDKWLAEYRTAFIMFVKLPDVFMFDSDPEALYLLHRAVQICQSCVFKYGGMIVRLLSDDKGIRFKIVFGMPSMFHEDDGIRCVKSAMDIEERLRGIDLIPSIGIASGLVFCGAAGSNRRCEYTPVGFKVILSARLMAYAGKHFGGGILLEEHVASLSGNDVSFTQTLRIPLKGVDDLVRVCCPSPIQADSQTAKSGKLEKILGLHQNEPGVVEPSKLVRKRTTSVQVKYRTLPRVSQNLVGRDLEIDIVMRWICKFSGVSP
eukprot:26765_1